MQTQTIPSTGYLRIDQILGNTRKGIPALLPMCRSTWYAGIREGKYPKSINLTERTVVWRVEDILDLIDKIGRQDNGS